VIYSFFIPYLSCPGQHQYLDHNEEEVCRQYNDPVREEAQGAIEDFTAEIALAA